MTADRAVITSTANPRIKALARLHERPERDRTGRFLIEGARELRAALAAGLHIEELVLAEELAGPEELAAASLVEADHVLRVGAAPYARISHRRHPDGILGIARQFPVDLARLDLGHHPLLLVADGVEKPGNLGAMLRTADAAAAAVLVSDPATDLFNPNVVRASQGSLFRIAIAQADAAAAVAWARERVQLLIALPDAPRPYWAIDMTGPVGFVVGSEHQGVSAPWRSAGEPVSIPMRGHADSLNTSVAAAVLAYEAVRQRARAAP